MAEVPSRLEECEIQTKADSRKRALTHAITFLCIVVKAKSSPKKLGKVVASVDFGTQKLVTSFKESN